MDLTNPAVLGGAVVLLLQSAVVYFLRSMAEDFKATVRELAEVKEDVAVLKATVARLERKLDP